MQTKTSKPDNSEIRVHKGGSISVTGRDGMYFYRALHVKMALSMWIRTGLRPTRGVGPTQMLTLASEYTGKTYKRGQHQQALDDLQVWLDTMKAAIPFTHEGEQQ
jgi:hypothetical protein